MPDNINTLFSSKELQKIKHIKEKINKYDLKKLYETYYKLDTHVSSKKTKSKHSSSGDSNRELEIYAIKDIIDLKEKEILSQENDTGAYFNYPNIKDDLFQYKIQLKEEFNLNKVKSIDYNFEDKCGSNNFNLSNYQRFVRTFMSPNTPYNGILLFHGTGVGKTCSAVQIAEQFKDFYDHKIRIILSQSIESGWKRNIYNPNKDSNQCTRNTYKYLVNRNDSSSQKDLNRSVNKILKEKYEFYGYQKFSNVVTQMKKSRVGGATGEEKTRLEIEAIRENFSNSLLINKNDY